MPAALRKRVGEELEDQVEACHDAVEVANNQAHDHSFASAVEKREGQAARAAEAEKARVLAEGFTRADQMKADRERRRLEKLEQEPVDTRAFKRAHQD